MGGPEKWQKRGRAKRVLSRFCRLIIKGHHHILKRSTFKFEVCREIFCFVFRLVYSQSISDRFSAHVRPVIQVAFQHVFSNMCTINNIINTIRTRNVYIIMLAPLCILGITGFCLTIFIIDTIKYMRL